MKRILVLILTIFLPITTFSTIEAGAVINGPENIIKEQYSILTLSEILTLYNSSYGSLEIIEDGYTGNGSTLGNYILKIGSSNGSNLLEKTVEIRVVKSLGFGVKAITNNKDIHIPKTYILNPSDIINLHGKIGMYELNETMQMSVLTDNYTKNNKTPGIYLYEYRLMDASGLDKVVAFNITVYESDKIEGNLIVIEKNPTLLDGISNAIKKFLSILFYWVLPTAILVGIVYIILTKKRRF